MNDFTRYTVLFAVFVLIGTVTGCDAITDVTTPEVAGDYRLETVEDQALPVIVIEEERDTATVAARVDAGSLTLTDGAYTIEFTITTLEDGEVVSEATLRQTGTYEVGEGEVQFFPDSYFFPDGFFFPETIFFPETTYSATFATGYHVGLFDTSGDFAIGGATFITYPGY